MKIAIISDIHGNVVALKIVLKDLEQQGGADQVVIPVLTQTLKFPERL